VPDVSDERKAKLREKFNKIKAKFEAKKEEALGKFKNANYADAIDLYKKAANILEIAYEDFSIFKKEIAQMEAVIFSNIALTYSRDKHDKPQIDYCSKVIDRALYLDEINILVKAYIRRGLAYEHVEKFKLAVHDFARVRELQPYNKQARDGKTRCLKCIKQDEGIDYKPDEADV